MHQQSVILIIMIIIIAVTIFLIVRNETFDSVLLSSSSSRDCGKFPEDPACKPPQCVVDADCKDLTYKSCQNGICTIPENAELTTCAPSDGRWSVPNADEFGRSKLNSPCCQPPEYKIASTYATCNSISSADPRTQKCLSECCNFVNDQQRFYDPSWAPMAKCGCALYCNNQNVTHFNKYGGPIRYLSGDIATAKTSDVANFINI